MRPMIKRHVSIFKKLAYLEYIGYPGYPRYSRGTPGIPCKDKKSLRKYVKGYMGPESQKDQFNTCQKIKNQWGNLVPQKRRQPPVTPANPPKV